MEFINRGLIFAIILISCSPPGFKLLPDQDDKYPDKSIRQLVEENLNNEILIGATTNSIALNSPTGEILDREFGYVTPGSDFKQSSIHPEPGIWNWGRSDPWVEHVRINNQKLRIHAPMGPQCSDWAKDDFRTVEELRTNMEEFFPALCKKYNGTQNFIYLDVVNETVIDGKWHGCKPGLDWECPWVILGKDTDKNQTPVYIKRAFEIANEYATDLKLIYNHHESPSNFASWKLIKETIFYLRNQGLRVDGIGWQSHVDVGWETEENLQALGSLIDWAYANDLEFHITEASVWLKSNTPENFNAQAKTYTAILEVLLKKRKSGVVGWNTWHIDDATGWRTGEFPAMFDAKRRPKPAYFAIKELLSRKGDNYP